LLEVLESSVEEDESSAERKKEDMTGINALKDETWLVATSCNWCLG